MLSKQAGLQEMCGSESTNASQTKSAGTSDGGASVSGQGKVRKIIEEAMRRRTEQRVVRFIDAVSRQDLKLMHEMLESGKVDVDDSDYDLRTALHVAASMGHRATVRILIERHSASHTVKDRYGGTPMDDAIRERRYVFFWQYVASKVACWLLCASRLALWYTRCRMDVVRYLAPLTKGESANCAPEKLIAAAADDDFDMVEALLLAGVDPNSLDFGHRTPLHLAVSNRSMKVTFTPPSYNLVD